MYINIHACMCIYMHTHTQIHTYIETYSIPNRRCISCNYTNKYNVKMQCYLALRSKAKPTGLALPVLRIFFLSPVFNITILTLCFSPSV